MECIDSYAVFLKLPAVNTTLLAIVRGTDWASDAETNTVSYTNFSLHLHLIQKFATNNVSSKGSDKEAAATSFGCILCILRSAFCSIHFSILRGMRENSNTDFHRVFVEATMLGETFHGETFPT